MVDEVNGRLEPIQKVHEGDNIRLSQTSDMIGGMLVAQGKQTIDRKQGVCGEALSQKKAVRHTILHHRIFPINEFLREGSSIAQGRPRASPRAKLPRVLKFIEIWNCPLTSSSTLPIEYPRVTELTSNPTSSASSRSFSRNA